MMKLTYKIDGYKKIVKPVSSIQDAVNQFIEHRDFAGFGSRSLTSKVIVIDQFNHVIATINYNGTLAS